MGAGQPDIIRAALRPELSAIRALEVADAHLLAYLRSVRAARMDTIVMRTHARVCDVRVRLAALTTAGVVARDGDVYRLVAEWRDILPEIIAIEAKVSDWRRAARQSARNRVFAHRVYVALPSSVAQRVRREPEFCAKGVGVVAVDATGECSVVRPARRGRPMVWSYYYALAALINDRAEGLSV